MVYRTIVADPPWRYDNKKVGGTGTSGSISKYNTMSIDEVAQLPVRELADRKAGACCYLWITVPLLDEGFRVLAAWGFKYKTAVFWHKQLDKGKLGMGYWYRGELELALFGICGPLKAYRSKIRNTFLAPLRKHSQKPDEFFTNIVEPVAPEPRIELFAAQEREGWSVWGNEVVGAESYVDIFEIPAQII
jgi:site-specific DNA-methyltransferase (adenine-specific)